VVAAAARKHAPSLTVPATRWAGPSGPLDQDRRWADALGSSTRSPIRPPTGSPGSSSCSTPRSSASSPPDRPARPAPGRPRPAPPRQQPGRPARPAGRPGRRARGRPPAAGRRAPGSSLLGVPSTWLFPGHWPGRALTEDALAQRLHALGISPRQGRSTALFTLAAEVPAEILAKTLGIHVQAAIQRQKISAGDRTASAADISDRADSHGPAGTADIRKPGPQQRAGTGSPGGK
jgi:hypothetical protein